MHVVLVEPLIPPNTGSVARLCAGTNTDLHLVRPLGFRLDDRLLKRAGLDYWPNVKLHLHASFSALMERHAPRHVGLLSSHATRPYTELSMHEDTWLFFGRETTGLPAEIHKAFPEARYKIPMTGHIRSLNLAMSVGIVLFEGMRQGGFSGLD